MAGGREENALRFGGFRRRSNVHLETKSGKVGENQIRADFKFPSGCKSERSIVYIEHVEDFEEGSMGEFLCRVVSDSSGGMG